MASERGQSQNMWKFAVYSGVRHGELAALAWEDVDLDKGVIHVCRNLTANGMFGPQKQRQETGRYNCSALPWTR